MPNPNNPYGDAVSEQAAHADAAQQPAPAPEPPADVAQLRQQLAELKEQFLREHAELDNQRKRMAREVEQARRYANERVLSDLLPVFDSLEGGLQAAGGDVKISEGLQLTLRQLLKVANDNGLVALDPVGQLFNPELHQAISQAPATAHAPGTVVQVFQRGYQLNGRLLRPALVVVASDG